VRKLFCNIPILKPLKRDRRHNILGKWSIHLKTVAERDSFESTLKQAKEAAITQSKVIGKKPAAPVVRKSALK
jgi:hypothetical protein